ncbi:MAG: YbaB/EbfC family nucleoid-associated protein [Oscillospiraceae bacterium]|jgi:DNA-binding YbaB/EbfC family protein|nr:YbaB/EbfC family nucleoid-associated protein [Oscillospiraceae bacterium]
MKARLPKGMGGGPSDMNGMIKQAQKMQAKMAEKQAELEEREFSATSGGGMVEVVINGKKQLKSISLKPEVVDPDDIEMLQDLLIAAANQAMQEADAATAAEMGKVTGGMSLPGMF